MAERMTPERWEHIASVCAQALEQPDSLRERFVSDVCAGDAELEGEVAGLLSASRSQLVIDAPLWDAAAALMEPVRRLPPGCMVAHHRIEALIGAGGMGEVYRAVDTTLQRTVAIKVLPLALAGDAERATRLAREARVLASLNHLNIAAIYGYLDEVLTDAPVRGERVQALVLEFVDGPTLADRLRTGPLPFDEAVSIARQVADALVAAHALGIIHRDLKPANIKVRDDGTVKVLDFGLATVADTVQRWATPEDGDVDRSDAPTVTGLVQTDNGVIVGTAAYMSPEQATGRGVDARSDVWALGCVLFDMLSGRRAFQGDDVAQTLNAVRHLSPDWQGLPPSTPPAMRLLVTRCLEKDRRSRLQGALVVRFLLDEPWETLPIAGRRSAALWTAAAVASAVVAATVGWRLAPRQAPIPVRAILVPPEAQRQNQTVIDRQVALSPDGRTLVHVTGPGDLLVRRLDSLTEESIAGVTDARDPFFSPDGAWLGFFAGGELRKVPIHGGPAVSIAKVPGGPLALLGVSWGDTDTIVFSTTDPATGILSVPARGGEPTVLTRPNMASGERDQLFPSLLPGGRIVLFTRGLPDIQGIANGEVAALNVRDGRIKTLVTGDRAMYADGRLVFSRAGTLLAARFDPERLELLESPQPIVDGVALGRRGAGEFAVAATGALVYVTGNGRTRTERSLAWVSRDGREEALNVPPRMYEYPRLSPDGTMIAVSVTDQEKDIYIWDIGTKRLRRLTADPGVDTFPVWTPDNRWVIFSSDRRGTASVFAQPADGSAPAEPLTVDTHPMMPFSISSDWSLIVDERNPLTGNDLMLLRLVPPLPSRGRREIRPVVERPGVQTHGEISPDGRLMAYMTTDSGTPRVFLTELAAAGAEWEVSGPAGGSRPAWARSGRELFYFEASSSTLMAVEISASKPFAATAPRALFRWPSLAQPGPARTYDVSRDGRFLMVKSDLATQGGPAASAVMLVSQWHPP
jgi:serine/threonine-protein kinase